MIRYRPTFSLQTGSLVGARAVVDPGEGLASLQHICRFARGWVAPGVDPVVVRVPIDHAALTSSFLLTEVSAALSQSRLALGSLELLVPPGPVTAMAALQGMGVRLAVPGSAIGKLTLAQMEELPIDKLILDPLFVRGLLHDDESAALCAGLIHLAMELKIRSGADGVDFPLQASFLKDLEADEATGGFFGPAMEAPAFERWWRARVAVAPEGVVGEQAQN